jgi:hypothetical protein
VSTPFESRDLWLTVAVALLFKKVQVSSRHKGTCPGLQVSILFLLQESEEMAAETDAARTLLGLGLTKTTRRLTTAGKKRVKDRDESHYVILHPALPCVPKFPMETPEDAARVEDIFFIWAGLQRKIKLYKYNECFNYAIDDYVPIHSELRELKTPQDVLQWVRKRFPEAAENKVAGWLQREFPSHDSAKSQSPLGPEKSMAALVHSSLASLSLIGARLRLHSTAATEDMYLIAVQHMEPLKRLPTFCDTQFMLITPETHGDVWLETAKAAHAHSPEIFPYVNIIVDTIMCNWLLPPAALNSLVVAPENDKAQVASALVGLAKLVPARNIMTLVSVVMNPGTPVEWVTVYFRAIRAAVLNKEFELAADWVASAVN